VETTVTGRSLWLVIFTLLFGVAAFAQGQETAVKRGEYLVTIGICKGCHLPNLGGGRRTGGILSANITPDKETGIGAWTDEQVIDAIRNGKRPDGSSVRPTMAVNWYRDLSDNDIRAIVAYLRSVPPVRSTHERSPINGAPPLFGPQVIGVADIPRDDKAAYGRYLATAVSHCMQCHTSRTNGRLDLARLGGGGNPVNVPGGSVAIAPNLTPGNKDGIATWTDAQLKHAITAGVRPNGVKIAPAMDFEFYEKITADDLDAMVVFLRSLPPLP
jgi:mono/diheme cytochrome c family protein